MARDRAFKSNHAFCSLLRVLGTFVGGVLGYGVLLALHYGPGKGEHLDCWQVNICLHLLV